MNGRSLVSIAALALVLALGGCGESETPLNDGGTDADSDSDADTDADPDGGPDAGPDAGCEIDGGLFGGGEHAPGNPCLVCDSAADATAWTPDDASACDDGIYCNGDEICQGGECVAPGGAPCPDDGLFCNGLEYCTRSACGPEWDPCLGLLPCDEAGDSCCVPDAARACSGDTAQILDSCGTATSSFDCGSIGQTCTAGMCTCPPGWSGDECDRCVIFVDGVSGDDGGTGASWGAALATVQAGLLAAAPDGCEVWVAGGVYRPTDGTDRAASFQLQDGIALYGGFAGTETGRAQRDPEANATVLSGDIGVPSDASDNSYHVVIGAAGAVIDGFTVSDGNADGADAADREGGGVRHIDGPLEISGCAFEHNSAASLGGAVFAGSGADLSVRGCAFVYNLAPSGSAIRSVWYADTEKWFMVSGSAFTSNGGDSTVDSGAMYTVVSGCEIAQNEGAGLRLYGRSTVIDSVVANNGGVGIDNDDGGLKVIRCVVEGNTGGDWGGGISVGSDWYYGIPIIVWDSFVLDNSAARGGGILVSLDDLVIKNAVFAGNTATEEGGAVFMAGWVSASGASFEGNAAGDCGGAIFLDGGDADEFLINSCAFGANTAPEHPQIGVPSTDWPTDPWNRAINSVFLGGFPGRRSIAADPGFASTAYPYDLSLQAGSPCIDAADSRAVPLLDIEGNPRTDDPSTPDTGLGPADHADIGAYEF